MLVTLASIFFGAAFTLAVAYALGGVALRKTPAPPEIRLAAGAVIESLLVFLLLLTNLGHWYVFLVLGAAAIFLWGRLQPAADLSPPSKNRWPATILRAYALIFGAYGLWYFVNALAPEILADGITYHLGLPYEYTRLGGFPDRVSFYDMVPQGIEMLYTMAFAFGRHSAAKLVEFGFFLATLPLIFRLGRLLRLGDAGSLLVAAFYFCAPVAGATGASSYNDAAGVFFALAAFYLLLLWRDTANSRYLFPAGALAGFCYAIKMSGVFAVAVVLLFLLSQRRWKSAALAAVGAAAVMAPWLIRNAVVAGNPIAPLGNALFPNPFFHLATERELAANLASLGSVAPSRVPWELAFGDHLDGTYGPLLLALPLGLLALRRREGRWCWAAAALLAIPWLSNTGARFLMPAVVMAGFALGMVLPRPLAWATILLQAVLCWPHMIGLWETRYAFRLHEFPLAAALRIEPESAYLSRHLDDFKLARIIEAKTPPEAKVLALPGAASAYLARDARVWWQSAEADRLFDTLRQAALAGDLVDRKASWPSQSLSRLRFRLAAPSPGDWVINDVRIYSGEDLVFTSPHWDLLAWPNSWEAPLALDGNPATRWRTWQPARAGMFLEIRFDHPQKISSAVLASAASAGNGRVEVFGLTTAGQWSALGTLYSTLHAREDLRPDAALALRRAGYRYLLIATGKGGTTPVGNAIAGHEPEWGLERVDEAGPYALLRVK